MRAGGSQVLHLVELAILALFEARKIARALVEVQRVTLLRQLVHYAVELLLLVLEKAEAGGQGHRLSTVLGLRLAQVPARSSIHVLVRRERLLGDYAVRIDLIDGLVYGGAHGGIAAPAERDSARNRLMG